MVHLPRVQGVLRGKAPLILVLVLVLALGGVGSAQAYVQTAHATQTGAQADTDAHNISFATTGLPKNTSVSVTYSGTNSAGHPISGTETFAAPGPSRTFSTQPNTTFTFSFPISITVGSSIYTFVSASQPSPFTTGGPGHRTTVTATYALSPSDTTPPVITPQVTGTLGNNGWYISDVTVTWMVTDTESAITSAPCDPTTIITDTDSSGVTVTCSATSAGGTSTASVTIKRDVTPPTLTGATTTAPNTNGWYNSDVTIHWTAADPEPGSGIDPATTPADSTLTSEGADLSASAAVSDLAGNTTQATVSGIKIDRTPPTITITTPADGAQYLLHQQVLASYAAADEAGGSGLASCVGPVSSGAPIDTSTTGNHTFTVTATDNAGNQAETTVHYSVSYRIFFPLVTFPLIDPSEFVR